jgi:hypothetical protein
MISSTFFATGLCSATTHLLLVPRSKNGWRCTFTPSYAFMAWYSGERRACNLIYVQLFILFPAHLYSVAAFFSRQCCMQLVNVFPTCLCSALHSVCEWNVYSFSTLFATDLYFNFPFCLRQNCVHLVYAVCYLSLFISFCLRQACFQLAILYETDLNYTLIFCSRQVCV